MKDLLRTLFDRAIAAVDPAECIRQYLPSASTRRIRVLGAGKAVPKMLEGVLAHFVTPLTGLVVTAYSHRQDGASAAGAVEILEAAHPLPDLASVNAGRRILELAKDAGAEDVVIVLISGGASALMECPAPTISLQDLQDINRQLLYCGASITEIVCVRKRLSLLKGGRLALAAAPAKVLLYAISDVPGDRIAEIGSGPCSVDGSSNARAREILQRYGVDAPDTVVRLLAPPDTCDAAAYIGNFAHVEQKIIARGQDALDAAAATAAQAGFRPLILGADLAGPAAALAVDHAERALRHRSRGDRIALISGGETTVRVKNPPGRGGRNSVYLLKLALALKGVKGIYAMAADTDGIDGTQFNAGAIIGPDSLSRAVNLGLSPGELLASDCSHDFFAALDDLIVTGPTGTNVNDLRVILVDTA